MTKDFNALGYSTIDCKPINASLNDLITRQEAWLRGLDFGSTKWLFVSAIEDVAAKASTFHGTVGGFEGGHAVVSGYLFEKQADVVKLVWRDRAFGVPWHPGVMYGATSKVKATETREAIYDAIRHLIWRFERRSDKRPFLLFSATEENVDAACSRVGPAFKEALGRDPKKYKVAFVDDSDMMALYTAWTRKLGRLGNEDHVVLRENGKGGSCVMQFTQAFLINEHRRTDDWGDLIKEVRSSIAK